SNVTSAAAVCAFATAVSPENPVAYVASVAVRGNGNSGTVGFARSYTCPDRSGPVPVNSNRYWLPGVSVIASDAIVVGCSPVIRRMLNPGVVAAGKYRNR